MEPENNNNNKVQLTSANIDWHSIESQVTELALLIFKGYTTQALSDLNDFRINAQSDLTDWVLSLKSGEISTEEFDELVMGEKELLELKALKQAGLGQVALDEFTAGVLQIVMTAVKSALHFP